METPIAQKFVEALSEERAAQQSQNALDRWINERNELRAQLTASQDALARANRFKDLALELFADPIKAIVKSEMVAYASDFDITAYEDEIKEIASDNFASDLSDHDGEINDLISFDIADHAADVETVVRDILRDATVKLEV
tara:strand:+ start:1401 stop:1823 length:423 start_codon:yes stop_codon:yes gene_type:complete